MIIYAVIEDGKLYKEFLTKEEAFSHISNSIISSDQFKLYRDNDLFSYKWMSPNQVIIYLYNALGKVFKEVMYDIVNYDVSEDPIFLGEPL